MIFENSIEICICCYQKSALAKNEHERKIQRIWVLTPVCLFHCHLSMSLGNMSLNLEVLYVNDPKSGHIWSFFVGTRA